MLLILSVGEMHTENVMWCFSLCGNRLGLHKDIYISPPVNEFFKMSRCLLQAHVGHIGQLSIERARDVTRRDSG